jgi:tetratricopeptide (TPR) repeat protein
MGLELLLCLSQEEGAEPYFFSRTGAKAGSVEEAAYHIYRNWKVVGDDIKGEEFLAWLGRGSRELAQDMAERLKQPRANPAAAFFAALGKRSGYISREDEKKLSAQILDWETRVEWERLKEEGDSLLRGGKPEKALDCYKKALERSRRPAILNNAGAACDAMGKHSLAVLWYSQALELDPSNSAALENCAQARIAIPDAKGARESIESLRSLRPSAPEPDILEGDLLMREGGFAKAAGFYERALEKESRDSVAMRLSEARRNGGEPQKAIEALGRVKEKGMDYHISLSRASEEAGNLRQAVLSAQEALRLGPDSPKALERAARVALRTGQIKVARQAAERAAKLSPSDAGAVFVSALAAKASGDSLGYKKGLEEALELMKSRCKDIYELEG